MVKLSQPRGGSLQFWPRKRIDRRIPGVNWKAIKTDKKGLLGFLSYKVGMASAYVKDLTPNSMTKDKKIILSSTILEIPAIKIFSIRFYKNNLVKSEIVVSDDKELKRRLKIGKKKEHKIDEIKDYDDIRLIIYSKAKDTGIKKTPDIAEVAIGGKLDEKLAFVKEKVGKEIFAHEFLKDMKIVDVRGLTKGKGLQDVITRFGIKLRQHKTEKGQRRPGTLGPWHPAHVLFRVPQAGQLGLFTRIIYNNKILAFGKISEKDINPKYGWKHYGKIKTEYLILQGSVQGAEKRPLLLTSHLRVSKNQIKKNYEFLGLK